MAAGSDDAGPRIRRRPWRVGLALATCATVVGAFASRAGALPSTTPDPSDPVDGERVYAVLQIGGTIYLGGEFSSVGGQPRANLAALDAGTGRVTGWNPGANEAVYALAGGPDGALYVGGSFSRVRGESRSRVAKFDPGGGLTDWTPTVGGGAVRALAVAGDTVYLGGTFGSVGGQDRVRLAALHTGSAALKSWRPDADGRVHAIVVHPGTGTVYAGGFFTTVAGTNRKGIAALTPDTGRPTSFVNGLAIPAYSLAFQASPGSLFVAGAGAGGTVGALDATTGAMLWKKSGNGDTQAVVASSGIVYLGGHFNVIAGASRLHIAAFDAYDGSLLGWDPGANGNKGVYAMGRVGNRSVLVGGDFTVAGGERRARFARFSGDL